MIVNTSAIYEKGRQAGLAGKRCGKTPYTQRDLQKVWISGWREGCAERRAAKK